jgi:hypothetical protein
VSLTAAQLRGDSEDEDNPMAAMLPNVERAEQIVYSNIKEGSLFSEPLALFFTSYEFGSTEDSEVAFPLLAEHLENHLQILSDAEYLKEVSIGRIGDDRVAFYTEESTRIATAAVRVEHQILSSLAVAMGGDPVEFLGEFLEEFIPALAEEERSLLPELADMPLGWESTIPAQDITDMTVPEATP